MSQLGQPSQVVGDSTDPAGTLRPNLPPEPKTGDKYNPMPHPEFDFEISLPEEVRRRGQMNSGHRPFAVKRKLGQPHQ
jgi:hypothetical protein